MIAVVLVIDVRIKFNGASLLLAVGACLCNSTADRYLCVCMLALVVAIGVLL